MSTLDDHSAKLITAVLALVEVPDEKGIDRIVLLRAIKKGLSDYELAMHVERRERFTENVKNLARRLFDT